MYGGFLLPGSDSCRVEEVEGPGAAGGGMARESSGELGVVSVNVSSTTRNLGITNTNKVHLG